MHFKLEILSLRFLCISGILLAITWQVTHLLICGSKNPSNIKSFNSVRDNERPLRHFNTSYELPAKRATDQDKCLQAFVTSEKTGAKNWETLVSIGDWLSTVMYSGSFDNANGEKEWCTKPSRWTDFRALAHTGWEVGSDFERDISPENFASLRQVYGNLGISVNKLDNRAWYFRQSKKVTVDGKVYEASGAIYNNIYNPYAIFAESNFGPATQPKAKLLLKQYQNGKIAYYPLTPLRQWSDVTFLAFQENCQQRSDAHDTPFRKCLKGLRVIVRSKIANPDTVMLVKHILKCTQDGDTRLKRFNDAKQFAMRDTEAAKALLQTANGAGVAWFLSQHKVQLGWKVVDRVVSYSCNGGAEELCIAFILADHADHKALLDNKSD